MTVKIKTSVQEEQIKLVDSLAEDFDGLKSENADNFIYTFERLQDEESFLASVKKKLQELDISFDATSIIPSEENFQGPGPVISPVHAPLPEPLTPENTPAQDYPPEVDSTKCDHISVFIESFNIVSYKGPLAEVDVVLNVSISNPETYETSSHKIVKHIAFDKIKLALETEKMTPYAVVESEEGKQKKALEQAKILAEQKQANILSRSRRIAGLE